MPHGHSEREKEMEKKRDDLKKEAADKEKEREEKNKESKKEVDSRFKSFGSATATRPSRTLSLPRRRTIRRTIRRKRRSRTVSHREKKPFALLSFPLHKHTNKNNTNAPSKKSITTRVHCCCQRTSRHTRLSISSWIAQNGLTVG